MKILTIIPTHNRVKPLESIVDQLLNQVLPVGVELEIFIVVDGSSDGTIESIRKYGGNVSYVYSEMELWYTKSINVGLVNALKIANKNDFILLINDDIKIPVNLLNSLVADCIKLKQDSVIGVVSIDQKEDILFCGVVGEKYCGFSRESYSYKKHELKNKIIPTLEIPGRTMFFSVRVLNDVGLFDDSFKQYGSDTDFCYRCLEREVPLYITGNTFHVVDTARTRIKNQASERASVVSILRDLFSPISHGYLPNYIKLHGRYYRKFCLLWKVPMYIITSLFYR